MLQMLRESNAAQRVRASGRAPVLSQQALESGGVKGRQAVAMHAACVYMACRLEHNPRTFKEILAGAPGTSKVLTQFESGNVTPDLNPRARHQQGALGAACRQQAVKIRLSHLGDAACTSGATSLHHPQA
jgi:Transcription factor TFIIB repeat